MQREEDTVTDTINGYPIIATWETPKRRNEEAGRIIVVDRGPEHEERYVVAWIGRTNQFWREAAYCVDLAEAGRVFAKRIEALTTAIEALGGVL